MTEEQAQKIIHRLEMISFTLKFILLLVGFIAGSILGDHLK